MTRKGEKKGITKAVGQVWVSRCGLAATVVEVTPTKVTLEDACGNKVTIQRKKLVDGFLWPTSRHNFYMGRQFTLKSGVTVTVTDYFSHMRVLVSDSLGNTKTCTTFSLNENCAEWPFYHPDNKGYAWNEGDTIVSRRGYRLLVVKALEGFRYLLMDEEGNEKVATTREMRSKRGIAWSHVLSSDTYYPKGFYVYVAHIDGVPYYIGSGMEGRYRHVKSGGSHSVLLNRHFFSDEPELQVFIHKDGMTKQEATALEYQMIAELSPKYNVSVNPNYFGANVVDGRGNYYKPPIIPLHEVVAQLSANVQSIAA